jgi:signal transduction histidine kinase
MTIRRVARFRPYRDLVGRPNGRRRLLDRSLLRILDLISILVAVFLVAAPLVWEHKRALEAVGRWEKPLLNDVSRVETDWMTFPRPPEFQRGDEPAVSAYLQAQPLVLALWDRGPGRALWVRRGDRLVPAGDDALARALGPWFRQAEEAQSFLWYPEGALPDEATPMPKLILRGDRWLVAKRWNEGSPEVERMLRQLLGPKARLRIALTRPGDDARKDLKPHPWGSEPNLQADGCSAQNAIISTTMESNEFSGRLFVVMPFRAEGKAIQRGYRIQMLYAALASAAVGMALIMAMYIRARERRKAALDADRMASMTHSLKTPLAILKFRCDTLRLGRVAPDQLDSQLIQIGEEADQMAGMIEKALLAIQGTAIAGPQELVTPEWIQGIVEDLAPVFEEGERSLVLACAEQNGRAALPSLRAAIYTLVENALFHGHGAVTVETQHTRKRFLIKVSDEGPGLSALELKSLGKPFMRIRESGQEGFRKDGMGLGLSLLCRMVEREGWGLTFASEPGRGLSATLEIQNA